MQITKKQVSCLNYVVLPWQTKEMYLLEIGKTVKS